MDRFGQTPMLSAINAPENRNDILKFFLDLIHDRDDIKLREVLPVILYSYIIHTVF